MKRLFKLVLFILRILLFIIIILIVALSCIFIYIFVIKSFFDTFSLLKINKYSIDYMIIGVVSCYLVQRRLEKYKMFNFWGYLFRDKGNIDIWKD